jgi:hypothetical protein
MAGEQRDDNGDEETPWYNRTPNVIGASVAGIAAIGIIIAAVTFVSRQFSEPEQAPLNFVTPSFSASASSSTPTTTATITSTSPPVTTDINGPSSTTSSSDTSASSGTDSSGPNTAWTRPYTPPSGEESAPSTTRRGPRTNVTRTLYPQP